MNKFVVFTFFMLTVHQLEASEVQCERKENESFHLVGSVKTCFMQTVTAITSPGFSITPKDDTIEGLRIDGNKKIHFLPEKVAEKFPKLLAYFANRCSVTEISKSNFEVLVKLRILLLSFNQIEKIYSNTFEDLKSLEYIQLSKKFHISLFDFQ